MLRYYEQYKKVLCLNLVSLTNVLSLIYPMAQRIFNTEFLMQIRHATEELGKWVYIEQQAGKMPATKPNKQV